jgi:hypothetical protein
MGANHVPFLIIRDVNHVRAATPHSLRPPRILSNALFVPLFQEVPRVSWTACRTLLVQVLIAHEVEHAPLPNGRGSVHVQYNGPEEKTVKAQDRSGGWDPVLRTN